MHTGRLLTICWSLLPGGVYLVLRVYLVLGVYLVPGGVLSPGVGCLLPGVVVSAPGMSALGGVCS